MTNDITLSNNCSVIMNEHIYNIVKNNIYNYNKIWGKNYSLNDIKSVAFRTVVFVIRLSEYDCISIRYSDLDF